MTYTNVWSTSTPANSDSSGGAAADMRKIRLDVQERMETLLGAGKWSDDPLTPYLQDLFMFVPWSDFTVTVGNTTWTINSGTQYGAAPGGSSVYTMYAGLRIPRGVEVTSIEVIGQTVASASLVATLEVVDATTGTVTQTTLATASMGPSITQSAKSSGPVSVTIDDDANNYKYYYIKLILTGTSTTWFQGVRVNYSRANIAQTL